jgi:hypothetical protein
MAAFMSSGAGGCGGAGGINIFISGLTRSIELAVSRIPAPARSSFIFGSAIREEVFTPEEASLLTPSDTCLNPAPASRVVIIPIMSPRPGGDAGGIIPFPS